MDNISVIADMVRQSERHANDLAPDRLRAIEYYNGEMDDTPADSGRSQMVTRDVRAQIKKVLPSIMRTIMGSDEIVEFQPVSEGDEEGAEQSSDYMNFIALPETNARDAIYDAVHDALLLRNGILKWWMDDRQAVEISQHSGLTEEALGQLVGDDEVEVLEQDTSEEQTEGPDGQEVTGTVYNVKIRRTYTKSDMRAGAVPRDRFLIHPDAVTLKEAPLVGEKTTISRSDLVAMGYDKDMVDKFSIAGGRDDEDERDARRDTVTEVSESERSNELVDYYDIYVRADSDGDGIAELRHMVFAGGLAEKNLLEDDECDEVQFCDICIMRQPHQWEGISLADDLMDIQRGKTVLLRQTLDNIYWQNNPQPLVQDGTITNMEAVMNPEFGLPIRVKQGHDVRAALGFNEVPFVAQHSYAMMEYLDSEAQDRTGVSDASAGLAPDALQNMTAKASAMIEQAAIGQTEMMVRTVAEGLRDFFRGLLRMSIRHADVSRTVRLRGEWVEIDPRQWNASMDCTVNTGLGAGTRERDMIMMQQIVGLQEKLVAGFGPDNPFVKPENISNAITKLAESAGLKTPSLYFNQPDEQEVEAKMEALRNQPNPEAQKAQMAMQMRQMELQATADLEQGKMQAQAQLEQVKMKMVADNDMSKLRIDEQKSQTQAEVARDKERAQMEADLIVEKARLESNLVQQNQQLAWEREKFEAEMALKMREMNDARQSEYIKFQTEKLEAGEE